MKHHWQQEELQAHFTLSPDDLNFLSGTEDHNRLGLALLLKYFAFEGQFPQKADEVPRALVEFVAAQLELPPEVYQAYIWQGRTHKRHRQMIRDHLGFRAYTG